MQDKATGTDRTVRWFFAWHAGKLGGHIYNFLIALKGHWKLSLTYHTRDRILFDRSLADLFPDRRLKSRRLRYHRTSLSVTQLLFHVLKLQQVTWRLDIKNTKTHRHNTMFITSSYGTLYHLKVLALFTVKYKGKIPTAKLPSHSFSRILSLISISNYEIYA